MKSLQYHSETDDAELTDVMFRIRENEIEFEIDNTIESQHFLAQHFRLPILCDFTLPIVKLAQIAYNAGQFKAERDNGVYNKEVLDFYDRHQLDSISTYV